MSYQSYKDDDNYNHDAEFSYDEYQSENEGN